MSELFNSLRTFASTGSSRGKTSTPSPPLNTTLREEEAVVRMMRLGTTLDSCTESGFNQWRDAMRMVARLPGGLPNEFRLRLWESLADRFLQDQMIDWNRVIMKCRSSHARDQEMSEQIEKDLHRTGCTGFSNGKQAVLKEVLLSYARWNPGVGYCQGFNMIGAMLLQMTSGHRNLTLKIFIFLIEGVLPQGYFSQGLKGLVVDMAVFREILKIRKPSLNGHLSRLQFDEESPPLTDVFTMHWFLTLFIHCLPTPSVLRIWDLVLLEGSEVLIRAALVLWAAIETRILCVSSADEFYSVMGVVTREMLEFGLMDPNTLVKCIVSVGPFPFPGLAELRHKTRLVVNAEPPQKSFFLAKRELENLKRHYSAIRSKQKATTVILRTLESKSDGLMRRQKGLLISTKKQIVTATSPKPKLRRFAPKPTVSHPSPHQSPIPKQQVTVSWNKIGKCKQRRRKRTASGSSSLTHSSSSSSTELCDSSPTSSSSDEESRPTPIKILQEPQNLNKSKSSEEVQNDIPCNSSSIPIQVPIPIVEPQILNYANSQPPPLPDPQIQPEVIEDEKIEICEESEAQKIIDTNDSQHFLEEMEKLKKSDSFFENLSQRICELQFQNLRILSTCNTTVQLDPMSIPSSPSPSPVSPIIPFNNGQTNYSHFLSPSNVPSSIPSPSNNTTTFDTPIDLKDEIDKKISYDFLHFVPPQATNVWQSPVLKSPMYNSGKMRLNLDSPSTLNESRRDELVISSPYDYVKSQNLHLDLSPTKIPIFRASSPMRSSGDLSPYNYTAVFHSSDGAQNDSGISSINASWIKGGTYGILKKSEIDPPEPYENGDGDEMNKLFSTTSSEGDERRETSEEINAVIRENIAILQRLKVKAEEEDDSSEWDLIEEEKKEQKTGQRSHNSARIVAVRTTKKIPRGKPKKVIMSTPPKNFNPFPTTRKSGVKTNKFGLHN